MPSFNMHRVTSVEVLRERGKVRVTALGLNDPDGVTITFYLEPVTRPRAGRSRAPRRANTADRAHRELQRQAAAGDVGALRRLWREAVRRQDPVLARVVRDTAGVLYRREKIDRRWGLPHGHPRAVTARDEEIVQILSDSDEASVGGHLQPDGTLG